MGRWHVTAEEPSRQRRQCIVVHESRDHRCCLCLGTMPSSCRFTLAPATRAGVMQPASALRLFTCSERYQAVARRANHRAGEMHFRRKLDDADGARWTLRAGFCGQAVGAACRACAQERAPRTIWPRAAWMRGDGQRPRYRVCGGAASVFGTATNNKSATCWHRGGRTDSGRAAAQSTLTPQSRST